MVLLVVGLGASRGADEKRLDSTLLILFDKTKSTTPPPPTKIQVRMKNIILTTFAILTLGTTINTEAVGRHKDHNEATPPHANEGA